ncbi:peptidoglycan-binding domain-containing protein [Micromonospora sp. NPDC047793]|uniref:peptidoglycan-binding domain-containing protein n=1 Tax=Micromonospora sp. NPDC047793 TaxID=3154342 RepID=UPI0033EDA0F5
MTRAPANLLAARRLLIEHLGPGAQAAGVTILDPLGSPAWEVGIVPDASHRGGYHCGSDRVVANDYSVVESPRDRNGLTLDAAALDVGMFRVRTPLGVFDLRHYSTWLVRQCAAGATDTQHIREVIYSPDGKVVRRWDRLGRRATGDRSHLTHTHESYFRDAIKAGADLSAVKRRYLIHIGLIRATGSSNNSTGGTSMLCKKDDRGEVVEALQRLLVIAGHSPGAIDGHYGDKTAAALLAARQEVGTQATSGDAYTAAAYAQLFQLIARKQAPPAAGLATPIRLTVTAAEPLYGKQS